MLEKYIMQDLINIYQAFKDILFYEDDHTYWCDNTQLTSTTTVLKDYVKPFDTDYWASYKTAQARGLKVKYRPELVGKSILISGVEHDPSVFDNTDMKKDWKYTSNLGTTRGSILHDYGELRLASKIRPHRYDLSFLKKEDKVQFDKDRAVLQVMFNQFMLAYPHLIPIKSELVVGNLEYLIGGMIDQLFWNTKAEELQLWDWKTDKKFRTKNEYGEKFLGCLSDLDNCELNKYSLQIGIYKKILELADVYTGDSYVVWFNKDNPTYQVIKLRDLSTSVNAIFNDRKSRA
jgi:hypothetical protein